MMIECFTEIWKIKGLKMNEDESKVILLRGKKESIYEVIVDWRQVEYVSEFKYLRLVFDESDAD